MKTQTAKVRNENGKLVMVTYPTNRPPVCNDGTCERHRNIGGGCNLCGIAVISEIKKS